MATFQVSVTNGQKAIVNSSSVTRIIDTGSIRFIYFGPTTTNNLQVTDTLSSLLSNMNR